MCNTITSLLVFAKGQESYEKPKTLIENSGISTNFSIYTFGLGNHFPEFLHGVSEETGGKYYNVPLHSALSQAFGSCFGEIISTYAEDLKVSVETVPGPVPFVVDKVFLPQFRVISGKNTEICFVLSIPPCSFLNPQHVPTKIIKGNLKYKILSTGEEVKNDFNFEITIYPYYKLYENIEIDLDTKLQFYRLLLAELLDNILSEDFEKACELLKGFYQKLEDFEDSG